MDNAVERRLAVATARADFLNKSESDLREVPPVVAASWRRSASSGVLPYQVTSDYVGDLDLACRLVRCAEPIIERLSEEVADIPISVALTDNRARILRRTESNSWIGRLLDNVSFAQGFSYGEQVVGTNGVGTVLEFGESVHIVGPEHYVESLQTFSCAGAPIRDPLSGRIEGVLDVSCLSEQSSPVMHSLVRSAARGIEQNLLRDRSLPQQALFDSFTRADARSREAVLAVGPSVVLANNTMRTLVDHADCAALETHLLFTMALRDTIDEEVGLPSGCVVRVRGKAVNVGADVVGMVALVSPLEGRSGPPSPRFARPTSPVTVGIPQPARRSEHPGVAQKISGTAPAWRAAVSEIEDALRDRRSLLVLGEPGTGKFTLTAELYHLLNDGCRSVAFEAADINASPDDTLKILLESDTRPTLYILRGLESLTRPTVNCLLDAIDRAPIPRSTVYLAATAVSPASADAPYQALLRFFDVAVTLPALRHRGADIPEVAHAILRDLAPHREVRLAPGAVRAITRYEWPGNTRQLREALSSALTRRPVGTIDVRDLPAYCHSTPRSALSQLEELERDAIIAELRANDGNRVATASALGLARSSLYRKIKHYGITR